MISITEFETVDQAEVTALILQIQREEFHIAITLEDQPDLQEIEAAYFAKGGKFWVAKNEQAEIVGTLAVVPIENQRCVIKKVFVTPTYRGKEKVGQQLLDQAFKFCKTVEINEIYLGTTEKFIAAQKFYQKNGFERIEKNTLPPSFMKMEVDNVFFRKKLER